MAGAERVRAIIVVYELQDVAGIDDIAALADSEVGNRDAAERRNLVSVAARLAAQVDARAASNLHSIITFAEQRRHVRWVVTIQEIIAGTGRDGLSCNTITSVDRIVAIAPIEDIHAIVIGESIIALAADQRVIAKPAIDIVVTLSANSH